MWMKVVYFCTLLGFILGDIYGYDSGGCSGTDYAQQAWYPYTYNSYNDADYEYYYDYPRYGYYNNPYTPKNYYAYPYYGRKWYSYATNFGLPVRKDWIFAIHG
uniref:Uncharacterized protein n=1 Tax=Acrobeloides nanus TaxID=290746 RepID=A0A914DVT0_9BILA